MAQETIRIALTEENYKQLVRGEMITVVGTQVVGASGMFTIASPPVEIILQDIGIVTMLDAIQQNFESKD